MDISCLKQYKKLCFLVSVILLGITGYVKRRHENFRIIRAGLDVYGHMSICGDVNFFIYTLE